MSIVAKRLVGSGCYLVWRHATLCWMGTQLPPPEKGAQQHRHFLAHVYCGEMVAHLSYC